MILLIEFYKNGGYGIIIIFFGIFLFSSSLIFFCGKEGGGRRPRKKVIDEKKKKEDPWVSEKSERSKKRKRSTKKRQHDKLSPPMALSQKKVDESGENLETGIQGSDVNVEMVENGSANGGDAPSSKNDKNDNEVEASQPGFGSENEKQPKSNNNIPRQSSESEKQKLAEKQKSANEQSSTPLISDNYESLKEKEEAKKAAILGETKNVQETPPAPPPPIPVSPSNPAPEKEEEKESESDKESSRKKSNKKKKKKHSKKKKKDKSSKKKKSTKKKKKKQHHHRQKEEEEEEKEKVEDPVIVYPYSLTPPSTTKNSKIKKIIEKGLTTRLNDELMTENGEDDGQQIVEATDQKMNVKSNFNFEPPPPPPLKSNKIQAKTTKTKILTGIGMEEQQIQGKTSLINVKNDKNIELPLVSAGGPYDGELLQQQLLPNPGPNEEQLTPTSPEPPPSPILQSSTGKNKILMATLGPADPTLTPDPKKSPIIPEGQNEERQILNPVNGGSLAITSKMKSPLLKKELTAKSDWKLFLNAAPVMSAKIDPQQIDESGTADVVMPSPSKKVVELQKTQKCSTKERDTLIPKIMPQSDKAKNIAQYGLKCGPAEYPTFGDVVSDWSTVDGVMTVEKMKEIDEKEIRRRKIIVEQQQQKDAIAAVATPPTTMKKENKDEEKIQQKKSKEGKNENVKVEEKEGKKKKKASKEKEEKKIFENEEERVKQLRENAPTPKKYKRTSWEEKIAKGEVVRKKYEYPTMNDVLSDWESQDSSSAAAAAAPGTKQSPHPKKDKAKKETEKK